MHFFYNDKQKAKEYSWGNPQGLVTLAHVFFPDKYPRPLMSLIFFFFCLIFLNFFSHRFAFKSSCLALIFPTFFSWKYFWSCHRSFATLLDARSHTEQCHCWRAFVRRLYLAEHHTSSVLSPWVGYQPLPSFLVCRLTLLTDHQIRRANYQLWKCLVVARHEEPWLALC